MRHVEHKNEGMAAGRAHHGGFLKKIMRNSFSLAAARVVEIVYGLLSMSIIARYLGINDFGQYAFIISVGALTTPLIDMGLRRIVIREIARDKENAAEYLGSTFFLRGIATGFLFLAAVTLLTFSKNETLYLVAFVMLDRILFSYEMMFTGLFSANENMGYETVITAAKKALNLILLLVIVFLDAGLKGIIVAMLLSTVVGVSFSYGIYRKKFFIHKLRVNRERCKVLFREAIPLALYAFVIVLFYRVDIYFLKYYRDTYEIGLYQAASQFVLMWNIIPASLASSLFPAFSRFAEIDKERFANIYNKALKYLLVLGLSIVLTILCLTQEIISLIYGSKFLAASSAMRILAWTLLLMFFNVLLNTILTAVNKQFYNTIAAAACLLLNVCLDALFVPRYGYISACYATLVSFILLFLATFYSVNKHVISINLIGLAWRPFASVAVPVVLLVVFKKFSLLFLIPSLIIYFAFLVMLKVISIEEIMQLKKVFKGGRSYA